MFLNKFYSFLDRNTKGKNVVFFFVIGFTLQFVVMGLLVPTFVKLSGGLQPLDIRMWYTPEDSIALLKALGDTGISFYLWPFLVVDIFFASMMSTAIAILINLLMKKNNVKYIYIPVFLPIVGLVFDYCENLMTFISILKYPNITSTITYVGAICTFSKQILFILAALLIILSTIKLIWIKITKRNP